MYQMSDSFSNSADAADDYELLNKFLDMDEVFSDLLPAFDSFSSVNQGPTAQFASFSIPNPLSGSFGTEETQLPPVTPSMTEFSPIVAEPPKCISPSSSTTSLKSEAAKPNQPKKRRRSASNSPSAEDDQIQQERR